MKKKYGLLLLIVGGGLVFLAVQVILGVRGVKVSTLATEKGGMEDIVIEEGVVKLGHEHQILSKVSGSIKEIEVNENSAVKAGDVLMVIDDRDLDYKKQICESTLAGYEAQLEQSNINQMMAISPQEYLDGIEQQTTSALARYRAAQTAWGGVNTLYEAGNVSKVEWEQVQAEYRNAQTAYQAAQSRYEESMLFLDALLAEGMDKEDINTRFYQSMKDQLAALIQAEKIQISQLEDQIADCVIKAEYDGIIRSLPAKDLSIIQIGQQLAIVSTNMEPIIEVEVLTTIEPYLKVGDPVVLIQKLRKQEIRFTGTIGEIYDFAEKGVSALGLEEYRVRVRIKVDEGQEIKLKSGYVINAQFTLYKSVDELLIPAHTIFQIDQQNYVYVIELGVIVKKPVSLNYKSSVWASVKEGLAEGEEVIDNIDDEKVYEGIRAHK